jgi:hypothetical protein
MTLLRKSDRESAVSEVIGVILVVALTVIMAAIIAAYVWGMIPTLPVSRTIALTASQNGDDQVMVVYYGGPDHASLVSMNITWPSGVIEPVDHPRIGNTFIAKNLGSGMNATPGKDRILITGRFVNNLEQILLDTYV